MKFLELTDKPRPDDGSEPIIKAFVKFTSQKLGLQEPPKIVLHRNPKLASQRRSFGGYMPGQGIEINIGNRHIMDVLRTLAHEMVHFKQDINGQLKPDSGRDGSDEENEANAKAAVVMRLWAKMNPELFQHATILAESQKKRLTPKNIHKIADKKGIKWDDEPAFLKLTRRVAGHRYLDDLDQDGLFKMKNYLDRLNEQQGPVNKLVIFDIDDTLVHTNTRVKVVRDGEVIKKLNSHEFTHYKLGPGEQFDFGAFRNAREFFDNAKPIVPMIHQLQNDIATGNKVVMITARADFDDRDTFLNTFRQWDVDMNKVHVYRAGNDTRSVAIDEKKATIIRNLMNQNSFSKVIMYDDSVPNLNSFIGLKKEYPRTKFYAWHVDHQGETSEFHRTDEHNVNEGMFDSMSPFVIKKMQTVLQKMGYNLGPTGVDGKIGPYTQSAIDAATSMKGPSGQVVNKNTPQTNSPPTQPQPRTRSPSFNSTKPVNGPITSAFGRRARGQHNGVDFGVPVGTPVKSPVSGVVKASGYTRGSQGNFVNVTSDNGEVHKFFHLSKVMIRAGARVNQGQVVGLSGNSGTSTGPHLHWEKHVSGYPTNPIAENFADGKNPQDKGDSARHGIPKKASLSSLDKITHSDASPRKKQLAHWQANMRRGRNK
jgi:murein DD-endopeptidase MepM/ murein hydrolase activator NlpD